MGHAGTLLLSPAVLLELLLALLLVVELLLLLMLHTPAEVDSAVGNDAAGCLRLRHQSVRLAHDSSFRTVC